MGIEVEEFSSYIGSSKTRMYNVNRTKVSQELSWGINGDISRQNMWRGFGAPCETAYVIGYKKSVETFKILVGSLEPNLIRLTKSRIKS